MNREKQKTAEVFKQKKARLKKGMMCFSSEINIISERTIDYVLKRKKISVIKEMIIGKKVTVLTVKKKMERL